MLDELITIGVGLACYFKGNKDGQVKTMEALQNHKRDVEIEILKRQIHELTKMNQDLK